VVEIMSSQFRCFVIDFPGYGASFSSRGRTWSLLENTHLVTKLAEEFRRPGEKIFLVGQDFGAAVSQLCALRIPHALHGLVLMNFVNVSEPPTTFAWPVRWRLGWLLKKHFASKPELRAFFEPARLRASWCRSARALEESWPGVNERKHWKGEIQKLSLPVLLLWGQKDVVNESDSGLRLMKDLPEAYFFENHEIGHWPHLENPAWVTGKMREFFFKVGAREKTTGIGAA
jgi:pimeloyl-ACP methyl ester carboxylesterase